MRKAMQLVHGRVALDIGIDLGTANTLVYLKGRGVVLNEPTTVAVNQKTGQLVGVGAAAKEMLGRTPQHIEVIRPLVEGVISDFEVTEEMLGYVLAKVRLERRSLIAPRVFIGVPCGITNVERRAARDAAKNAGAREVYLIEEPMAAAIGAKLPVKKAVGSMVIDVGGGTANIAVLSYGGVVTAENLRIAGDHLNAAITNYVREQFKILIGDSTAERAKIQLATVAQTEDAKELVVRGRDVVSGAPREVAVTDGDIRAAIAGPVDSMVETVRAVLERTPPEVVADIMQRGIHVSGGGALIPGFAALLEDVLQVPVITVPDPLRAVIRGIGTVIEQQETYAQMVFIQEETPTRE